MVLLWSIVFLLLGACASTPAFDAARLRIVPAPAFSFLVPSPLLGHIAGTTSTAVVTSSDDASFELTITAPHPELNLDDARAMLESDPDGQHFLGVVSDVHTSRCRIVFVRPPSTSRRDYIASVAWGYARCGELKLGFWLSSEGDSDRALTQALEVLDSAQLSE